MADYVFQADPNFNRVILQDIEGNKVCPIEEAVTVMEKYLRDENKTDLTNHLLQDVENTMNVVWGLNRKNA